VAIPILRGRSWQRTLLMVVLTAIVVCVPAVVRAHQQITSQAPLHEGSRFRNSCESVPSKVTVTITVLTVRIAMFVPIDDRGAAWFVGRPDAVPLAPQAIVSPHGLRAPPSIA